MNNQHSDILKTKVICGFFSNRDLDSLDDMFADNIKPIVENKLMTITFDGELLKAVNKNGYHLKWGGDRSFYSPAYFGIQTNKYGDRWNLCYACYSPVTQAKMKKNVLAWLKNKKTDDPELSKIIKKFKELKMVSKNLVDNDRSDHIEFQLGDYEAIEVDGKMLKSLSNRPIDIQLENLYFLAPSPSGRVGVYQPNWHMTSNSLNENSIKVDAFCHTYYLTPNLSVSPLFEMESPQPGELSLVSPDAQTINLLRDIMSDPNKVWITDADYISPIVNATVFTTAQGLYNCLTKLTDRCQSAAQTITKSSPTKPASGKTGSSDDSARKTTDFGASASKGSGLTQTGQSDPFISSPFAQSPFTPKTPAPAGNENIIQLPGADLFERSFIRDFTFDIPLTSMQADILSRNFSSNLQVLIKPGEIGIKDATFNLVPSQNGQYALRIGPLKISSKSDGHSFNIAVRGVPGSEWARIYSSLVFKFRISVNKAAKTIGFTLEGIDEE